MDDMYREMIVDRFKNPHYRGELDPHDYSYEDDNPTCGDHIRIDIRVDENEMVTEAAFSGEGCSISQASADMLIEAILNKPLDEVKAITKEQVLENLGIELGPVRLKCALLSLKVLKGSVYGLPEGGVSDELLGA
jgi:nitrogen fixation NifU-like protein